MSRVFSIDDYVTHMDAEGVENAERLNLFQNAMEANSTLVMIEVIKMMTGLVSVFYEAWQPITKKSIVHAEELLLRAKNNLQTFPIVVYVHLKPQFRLVVKLWEIMLAKVRLETHSSFKQVNFYPDDILPLFGDITKLMKNEMSA